MKNLLTTAVLKGMYRNREATVIWTRGRGKGWGVSIRWGNDSRRVTTDIDDKPCWTVSMRLIDQAFSKANPAVRQYAKQISKEQGLRIHR